jgi:hypothetical protein
MRTLFHMALLVSALAVGARANADEAAECTADALLLSHFGRAFDACRGSLNPAWPAGPQPEPGWSFTLVSCKPYDRWACDE